MLFFFKSVWHLMQFSLLYMKIAIKEENMNVFSVTAVQVHSYNVLTYR